MFNPRKTIVRRISATEPEPAIIAEAAEVLRRGGLVAFPTETVYGLGANALDAAAVESIFAAKGRPAINPVIVHVADVAAAQKLTPVWPDSAAKLAERFWPGPLTLVLPKISELPSVVTAGGATVGLRVPAHPVALALLQAAQVPVAAPSANRSMRVSPTLASHVQRTLEGRVDLILDAGPTPGGLESTVIDLTVDPPRVLRPGLITIDQIEAKIGSVAIVRETLPASLLGKPSAKPDPEKALRSPGLLKRHYAPRATVLCIENGGPAICELAADVKRVGWLRFNSKEEETFSISVVVIDMPRDPTEYAARLYAAFYEMDEAEVEAIVVDVPPGGDAWLAVHDRLRRASQNE